MSRRKQRRARRLGKPIAPAEPTNVATPADQLRAKRAASSMADDAQRAVAAHFGLDSLSPPPPRRADALPFMAPDPDPVIGPEVPHIAADRRVIELIAERDFLIDRYVRPTRDRDTGLSSDALLRHALNPDFSDAPDEDPLDSGDFGRCARMYERAPNHLRPRMIEWLLKWYDDVEAQNYDLSEYRALIGLPEREVEYPEATPLTTQEAYDHLAAVLADADDPLPEAVRVLGHALGLRTSEELNIVYLDVSGSMTHLPPDIVDSINHNLAAADAVIPFTLELLPQTGPTTLHAALGRPGAGGGTDLRPVIEDMRRRAANLGDPDHFSCFTVITDDQCSDRVEWPTDAVIVTIRNGQLYIS